jgi:hypothetical protein
MLFLTIIQRIHVRFENEAPVFYVDARGPIRLTKNTALSTVWALTLVYGLVVALLVYLRPSLNRRGWIATGFVVAGLCVLAALAEPLWAVVILADYVALYPVLSGRVGTEARW